MASALPAKRERTRAALLVAVQELLLDPAVVTISVPQIVSRAGAAQGTFYNYFDSLPEALEAVGALLLIEHARVLEVVTVGSYDDAELVARTTRQTLLLLANRPDVGRLLFDSGVAVDRFVEAMRGHLRRDLLRGAESGIFVITDFDVTLSLFVGSMLGATLDIYRGRLTRPEIPRIVAHLLRELGVGEDRIAELAGARQRFIPWRPLPLSPLDWPV